jgi:hypothetical protein
VPEALALPAKRSPESGFPQARSPEALLDAAEPREVLQRLEPSAQAEILPASQALLDQPEAPRADGPPGAPPSAA